MSAELSINLKLKGRTEELTIAEAKDLLNQLQDLLGREYQHDFLVQPIVLPVVDLYPKYPPLTPWCGEPVITYGPPSHTTCTAGF